MKTAFQHSALLSIVALAMVPMSAFADDKPLALYEITLDIDNDGKTDRAVLVLVGSDRTDIGPLTDELYAVGDGESVDLYLYLAAGEEKLDLSRKPAVLKKKIVDPEETPWVQPLESKDSRSLVVASCYGCGANKSWGRLQIFFLCNSITCSYISRTKTRTLHTRVHGFSAVLFPFWPLTAHVAHTFSSEECTRMSVIVKLPSGSWRAQVRRKGKYISDTYISDTFSASA